MTPQLVLVKPAAAAPMTKPMTATSQPDGLTPEALGRLCQLTQLGNFDEALAVLAGAEREAGAAAALAQLREVVAFELVRRVECFYRDLTPRAVHALGISPLTSDQMVVDRDDVLHLVAERVPNEDAIGEELHCACGLELWSDLETPQLAGIRGSWQAADAYRVSRCSGCAAHAHAFAVTRERPGDAALPPAVAERIGAAVASRVRATLEDQVGQLAIAGAVAALETAEELYVAELVAALAAKAKAGGDAVLRPVLLRYFDTAERELQGSGHRGPLANLITDEHWREAVANTLEDLQEADNGAVAQSYLYGELRSILGEQIRRNRLHQRA